MRSRLFALLLAGALGAAPICANAAPPADKADAQAHFRHGVDLFGDGDYRAALVEFRRSYEKAKHFGILYNIGQCQYQLLDYAGALRTFTQYLRDGGDAIAPERKVEVERDLATLGERIGKIRLAVNEPGASVSVDGVLVGTTPLAEDVVVSVGTRQIVVSKDGFAPVDRTLDIAAQETANVRLELVSTRAPRAPIVAPVVAEERPQSIPWALWGTSGALAIGALVTGGFALKAGSDLDAAMSRPDPSADDLASKAGGAKTLSVTADLLGAAALIVGGISLYLTLKPPATDGRAAVARRRAVVFVSGAGAGLGSTW